MITNDYQGATEIKLNRIEWLSSQDKGKSFKILMNLFNENTLTGIVLKVKTL